MMLYAVQSPIFPKRYRLCYLSLTHIGRVTYICVGNLTIIASDNGLSPGRRRAIIWTILWLLLIEPSGANFSEIVIEIHISLFKIMHLKMSSGKWRPFCLGLNELLFDHTKHFTPYVYDMINLQANGQLMWHFVCRSLINYFKRCHTEISLENKDICISFLLFIWDDAGSWDSHARRSWPSISRAEFMFAPSQWEMSLQSNAVSHWLGANLGSSLISSHGIGTVIADLSLSG